MAIDPKEVRIGSHVNANGVRAKVIDIHNKTLSPDCKYQIFVEGISPEDGEKKVVGSYAVGLDPIPITPELLTELGFRKHEKKDKWIKCGDPYIEFTKLIDDRWGLLINPFDDTYNAIHRVFVRYLHQAELFLYLATKQELIND